MIKKDVDEPTHPVGWHDNVQEQGETPTVKEVEEDCRDMCNLSKEEYNELV